MTETKQEFSSEAQNVAHCKAIIKSRKTQLLEVLPPHINPDRAFMVLMNAITRNKKLAQCTDLSILNALATCGAFGLEPNTPLGQCHIIPYRNKHNGGKLEANFQMGYQGLIELARRAGTTIRCGAIHENDEVLIREGFNEAFDISYSIFKPRGEIVAFYSMAITKEGIKIPKVMTKEECIEHGKRYSKTYNKQTGEFSFDSGWRTAENPMCQKTVINQNCKYSPKSILAEWVDVERRTGIDLKDTTLANALVDDDDNTIDTQATEPTGGDAPIDLDAVADKFEENESAGSPPYDDAPEQKSAGKPTRGELIKALTKARDDAKWKQRQLDEEIQKQFGEGKKTADLTDEQVMTMIEVIDSYYQQ